MINPDQKIYLASKSPRRRKLLKQLGIKFKSFAVDLDEEIIDGEATGAEGRVLRQRDVDQRSQRDENQPADQQGNTAEQQIGRTQP